MSMNVFNRLVVLLLLLGIIALVVTFFIWTYPTLNWMQYWLSQAEASISIATWPIILAGGIGIILFCFILILLELVRRRPKTIRIQKVRGGRAELRVESIGRRVAWHVDRLSDVVKATPRVRASGRGVDLLLNLETGPDIDVPMKTEEVLAVVREQVEGKMGLKLRNVNVRIKNAPFPEDPGYAREAAQSWSTPAPEAKESEASWSMPADAD
jgi:hypothetical protein